MGNQLSKHGLNKTTIETLGLQLEQEGFTVFYASDKKSFPIRLLDMVYAVFKYWNQVSYILIDTYSTKAFWYAFVSSQLARIFNIKYIPILHGGDLPTRLKNNPTLCRMVFTNAYQNVAPSGYLKHAFEKEGYMNVVHIPNSIEINKYDFKQKSELIPKLLWVRAFATIYNPQMAVKVLYELKKTHPQATLCMVGPDKDGSMLKTKKVADDLGVSVLFTGKLSKDEWTTLADDYNVFINTTHFDNTPVSVIEAMSLGLAVVTTNVGGIPFLLEDRKEALLVPDSGILEMVSGIREVLENPDLFQQLTTNARRKASVFDWETVKQEWFKILQ